MSAPPCCQEVCSGPGSAMPAVPATQDATALALAAEGFLNLVPWDFVDPSTGDKRPEAATAEALLLRALRAEPAHPLALHLHVHLSEAQVQAPPAARGRGEGTGTEG